MNANQKTGIALPSITLTKDKKTVVVIGADESFIADALASKTLFGAYYNFISTDGVSSFFNGCIAAAAAGTKPQLGVPVVVSQGKTVVAIAPDNMTHPATHLVFFEKGAVHSKLSEETAVEKIVSLSDESKAEIAKTLVKGVSINTYGNAKDILALL